MRGSCHRAFSSHRRRCRAAATTTIHQATLPRCEGEAGTREVSGGVWGAERASAASAEGADAEAPGRLGDGRSADSVSEVELCGRGEAAVEVRWWARGRERRPSPLVARGGGEVELLRRAPRPRRAALCLLW